MEHTGTAQNGESEVENHPEHDRKQQKLLVETQLMTMMRQVPAVCVSERLWCCWVREVGLVVGERPSKSGAPATWGWQCTGRWKLGRSTR
jgi:hypothetical protein